MIFPKECFENLEIMEVEITLRNSCFRRVIFTSMISRFSKGCFQNLEIMEIKMTFQNSCFGGLFSFPWIQDFENSVWVEHYNQLTTHNTTWTKKWLLKFLEKTLGMWEILRHKKSHKKTTHKRKQSKKLETKNRFQNLEIMEVKFTLQNSCFGVFFYFHEIMETQLFWYWQFGHKKWFFYS